MQGEIYVEEVIRRVEDERERVTRWQERMTRRAEAFEEQAILRQWWQATERDRPEIVSRHREVFARIRENKRRAQRIAAQERALVDAFMRASGYSVREDGTFPRYVRR